MAQVLRAELAARRINGPTFAGMVGESKANAWRKIEGYVKISFDDLDRYAAALDLSVKEVMDRAVELQRNGHVYDPNDPRSIAASMKDPQARAAAEKFIAEYEERRKRDEGPDERPKEA